MTVSFEKPSGKKRNKKANGESYTLHTDQNGQFYNHPQKGRVMVIALFCDCGRSVLVAPKEAKKWAIVCSHCNTAFRWQQLTFLAD